MKALIIGAAGFVGRHLINELACEGHGITATKLPFEKMSPDCCSVIDLDILDEQAIFGALNAEKPNVVFHLAAQSSSAVAWKNPGLTIDVNIKGSVNLLEALRKLDWKPKIILVGSSEEYGNQEKVPVDEDVCVNPDNIYAITRSTQNRFGLVYAKAYGLSVIMTRSFNHIGIGHAESFAIPSFAKQISEIARGNREAVLSVGNLSVRRDYIDVRDVCKAYVALAKNGVDGETYNIGSGKAVALQEIVDTLIGFSGKQIEIRVDPNKLRPVDTPVIEADIRKIKKLVGWTPQIPLAHSLREVYDWYLAQ